MAVFRPLRPIVWGKVAMVPHREPQRRQQCRGCAGGGTVNEVICASCGGRGWSDAANPPRTSTTTTADDTGIY